MVKIKKTLNDKNKTKAPDNRKEGEKKQLTIRIAKRFARHQDDELMMWLKSYSRRHLLDRLNRKNG